MEPHIQYAQTKDGVSIAYWTRVERMRGLPFGVPGVIVRYHSQVLKEVPRCA